MNKLRYLIGKIRYIVDYIYYFNSSIIKNTYLCKLLGEKINFLKEEPLIVFKLLGKKSTYTIPLSKLLCNKKLVEGFHPADALKLGSLALNDVFLKLPEHKRCNQFNKIKTLMLNSTHDVYANILTADVDSLCITSNQNVSQDIPMEIYHYLDLSTVDNIYPYKLVGGSFHPDNDNTIIIYTIFGKRDGYKKPLKKIIAEHSLIAKFHPTEAVKFGFIHAGDNIFSNKNHYQEAPLIGQEIIS